MFKSAIWRLTGYERKEENRKRFQALNRRDTPNFTMDCMLFMMKLCLNLSK